MLRNPRDMLDPHSFYKGKLAKAQKCLVTCLKIPNEKVEENQTFWVKPILTSFS
jgi:hypothetical protein